MIRNILLNMAVAEGLTPSESPGGADDTSGISGQNSPSDGGAPAVGYLMTDNGGETQGTDSTGQTENGVTETGEGTQETGSDDQTENGATETGGGIQGTDSTNQTGTVVEQTGRGAKGTDSTGQTENGATETGGETQGTDSSDQTGTDAIQTGEGTIVVEAIPDESKPKPKGGFPILLLVLIVLLAICGVLLAYLLKRKKKKVKKKEKRKSEKVNPVKTEVEIRNDVNAISCGIAQTIGARDQQQDSAYCSNWKEMVAVQARGILAAVSDGIGGLQDGNLASQGAMQAMRAAFLENHPNANSADRLLMCAAAAQNKVLEINRTGNRCGATLVSVLITGREMNFLSIGDSRICLYRSGALLQLNREHIFGRQNAERESFEGKGEQITAKRAGALTSYLGKEELTLIDRSLHPLKLLPGDRVILMSDGVFNTLSDDEIISFMHMSAQDAADSIIKSVNDRANPRQDNATILVIGIG
ncbi:MAG: protein phosphatase 2C domain-containing protein [Clostridia bacterium]|nr:protein phosphatase 2C domain-containing protein [Clostridia bacterium]